MATVYYAAPTATYRNGTQSDVAPEQNRYNFGEASLYIGDLDPSVTEKILHDKFAVIGPIASVRIIVNRDPEGNLNYGYVNFEKREDAEKAMSTHKFDTIDGSPCRIMWSQRDSALRSSVSANVFVRGLSPVTDNKRLQAVFAPFGDVVSCKIVYDEAGTSKCYGFVQFEKEEDAQKLLAKLTNLTIDGVVAEISKFVSRSQPRELPSENTTNLFVKNIPEHFDQDDLKGLFVPFGAITSCVVMKDPATGVSRRFGFVNFVTAADADKAITELDQYRVDGARLIVNRAQNKRNMIGNGYSQRSYDYPPATEGSSAPRRAPAVNVYVKHLDRDVDENALCDAFESFGTIVSAKIVRETSGESKGFGFLVFSHPDEAAAAVTGMNGKTVGTHPVYVALSHHNERRGPRHFASSGSSGGDYYNQYPYGMVQAAYMQPQMYSSGYGYMGYPQQYAEPYPWTNAGPFPAYPPNAYPTYPLANVPPATPDIQPLTPEMMDSIPEGNRKQVIGDHIYSRIETFYGPTPFSGKITGMLLELGLPEVLRLVQDVNALRIAADAALGRLQSSESS
jgi:polyadenylate-binding protein